MKVYVGFAFLLYFFFSVYLPQSLFLFHTCVTPVILNWEDRLKPHYSALCCFGVSFLHSSWFGVMFLICDNKSVGYTVMY